MPVTEFLHGVEVIEINGGPLPVKTLRSSVIGIVGTAPGADPETFPLGVPALIAGSRTVAAKLEGVAQDADGNPLVGGTLPEAVDAILTQGGAAIVVIRVEEGDTPAQTKQAIIDAIDADNTLVGAESVLGLQPRILIAPRFSHEKLVADALLSRAERLKAIAIIDGPNTTDEAARTYRNEFDNARGYLVDPWVKTKTIDAAGEEIEIDVPPSPYVAGLIAKIDADKGFWWSPSNNPILGITATSRPIDFLLGDENSTANQLNKDQISTIIREGGYRLWGNHTLAASNSLYTFLPIRRTADIINDSLKRASFPFVDQPITKALAESIVETVNAYLRSLVTQGAILGGQCWFDRDANQNPDLQAGKIRFRYKFQPPTPAEHLIYESAVVTEYFDVLFK